MLKWLVSLWHKIEGWRHPRKIAPRLSSLEPPRSSSLSCSHYRSLTVAARIGRGSDWGGSDWGGLDWDAVGRLTIGRRLAICPTSAGRGSVGGL